MSSRHNARRAAVQALYQWDLTSQAADQIEQQFSQIHDMQNIDKKYLREILREVPRLKSELEQKIAPHLDRDFVKLDPVERAILRIGAYELCFRPDVPTKVVMNEMIELAKVFGSDHSYKFINGVMDKMAKATRPASKTAVSDRPVRNPPADRASPNKAAVDLTTENIMDNNAGVKKATVNKAPANQKAVKKHPLKQASPKSSES